MRSDSRSWLRRVPCCSGTLSSSIRVQASTRSLHLHRLHADDEIGKAVAVGQVAALPGAIDAGGLDRQLRVLRQQPLVQDSWPRAAPAAGAARPARPRGAPALRASMALMKAALLPVFGFHADQFAVHGAALDLGTDRILLRREAAGVARLGDFLEAGGSVRCSRGLSCSAR
jgi:hypothetical protein